MKFINMFFLKKAGHIRRLILIILCFLFALQPFLCYGSSALAPAPAVFTVTNGSDSGPGSLRQAILDANGSTAQEKIINFTTGENIVPSTVLPTLTVQNTRVSILSINTRLIFKFPISISSGGSLILDGVNIDNYSTSASIYAADGDPDNKLLLSGYNTIMDSDYGITVGAGCSLTIKETTAGNGGQLNVTGQEYGLGKDGTIHIQSGIVHATGINQSGISGNVTIAGGTVNATGGHNGSGINGTVTITDGSVRAIGGYHGSGIDGTVTIAGGTIDASSDGAGISGTVTINGGTINTIGKLSAGGIAGTITINGGIVNTDGGSTAAGILSIGALTVNGGQIHAAGFEGIYAFGSDSEILINGGTVVLTGNHLDIYSDSGVCKITGGSVNARKINCNVVNTGGITLYLDTVTVGTTPLLNTAVTCTVNGGTPFTSYTDNTGKLYLWMPVTAAGEKATVLISDGSNLYWATGTVTGDFNNTMTAAPLIITTVTVNPSSATVQRGNTQQFTAVVTGNNNPPQTVIWSVSGMHSGTSISDSGLLTVAANETSETLTVKAVSVDPGKFASAIVTVPQPVTVLFDSQGGSAVPSQTVEYNCFVTKPVDPTQTGYTFAGWYQDSSCTQPWDFDYDKVTGNTTLYAKWEIDYLWIVFIMALPLCALLLPLLNYIVYRNDYPL